MLEQPALEVRERGLLARGPRRKLLDPVTGQSSELRCRPRERAERTASGLVRERDRHVRSSSERRKQRPLGAGEVLETVGEHRTAVPGLEVVSNELPRVATLELSVRETEAVQLCSVLGVEGGEGAVAEIVRLEQSRLDLGDRLLERRDEPRKARGDGETVQTGARD